MNIAIVGSGTMGRLVREMAEQNPKIDKVCNLEPALGETLWDVKKYGMFKDEPDVIIDFSHPDALTEISNYLLSKKGTVGAVLATTGYAREHVEIIEELSKTVPVMQSANYSYGIFAMKKLLEKAVDLLAENSDIEIVEKHHNQKIDAPSGTALSLLNICDGDGSRIVTMGRKGEKRREREIGIHSIRAGTIFGEHSVLFAMNDEVIEIKHTAFSKRIFAKGALEAAMWIKGKQAGLYTLESVFV